MSATVDDISDEGLARLNAKLAGRSRRSPNLALADRAAQPTLSIGDEVVRRQVEAVAAPEEVDLPGDLAAKTRLARAALALRLRGEGMTAHGSDAVARRLLGAAVLRMDGISDPATVAKALGTSARSLKRDRAWLRRVDGAELVAELEDAA